MKQSTDAAERDGISSRTADAAGLRMLHLSAGEGPALILLHGYTQTSRMWRPLIPLLARIFTVIAPDLPGIGLYGVRAGLRKHDRAKARIVELQRDRFGAGRCRYRMANVI